MLPGLHRNLALASRIHGALAHHLSHQTVRHFIEVLEVVVVTAEHWAASSEAGVGTGMCLVVVSIAPRVNTAARRVDEHVVLVDVGEQEFVQGEPAILVFLHSVNQPATANHIVRQ